MYKTIEAPVATGRGIRIDVEFDGPVGPELAHVLATAITKTFAAMNKPKFVRALVELI